MSLEMNLKEKLRPHADRVASGHAKDEFDFLPAALHSGLEHAQQLRVAVSEQREMISAQSAAAERSFNDAAMHHSESTTKVIELLKLIGSRVEQSERMLGKQLAALSDGQSAEFEILRKRHRILMASLLGIGAVTLALLTYLAFMLKH